mmetsp:Transcript_40061/g.85843  ORF Transcript_40061/g.85843 Transcript_40061/m.85843 type:complete len:144 (-) Transcript_40061:414-845(-)
MAEKANTQGVSQEHCSLFEGEHRETEADGRMADQHQQRGEEVAYTIVQGRRRGWGECGTKAMAQGRAALGRQRRGLLQSQDLPVCFNRFRCGPCSPEEISTCDGMAEPAEGPEPALLGRIVKCWGGASPALWNMVVNVVCCDC